MKKLLSILLCLVMVCTLLPAMALAEDLTEVKLTAPAPVEGQTSDDAKPIVVSDEGHGATTRAIS